jgi:hypothetical protein
MTKKDGTRIMTIRRAPENFYIRCKKCALDDNIQITNWMIKAIEYYLKAKGK